jgi:hypothetical protein
VTAVTALTSQDAATMSPPHPFHLVPGQVAALVGEPGSGLTRIGLALIAAHAGPVACLDVRGWLSPLAAWEMGISPDRLLIVRCADVARWSRATATLLGGVGAVYAEVPAGVNDVALRKLGALARSARTALVLRPLRGPMPSGVAALRIEAEAISWEGPDAGHGRLERRRLHLTAAGKAVQGMTRAVEVEDDGANAVRMVPRLAVAEAGRTG